jgi:GntR family transcriptional regulator
MILDKNSPIPAYYQLKTMLQNKIQNGEYQEGELIPSERELSENFNISRMTVRQALNQLVVEGLIIREKGRGTFVARRKIEQRNICSFSETVKLEGRIPSTKVLRFEKIPASQDICSILDLNKDELIYAIKRLRFADGIPVAIEEVFIPEYYLPGFERFKLDTSLYRLIYQEYGYSIDFMDNKIEASIATQAEKKLLKIMSALPVLRITGISYIPNNRKFSYERDVYRSDQYSYNARIFMNKEPY